MRLTRSVLVRRPPAEVFAVVSDVDRYCEFFHGMTQWRPLSRKRRGKGARYRVLLEVGSIEAGGIVTVTEWVEGRSIAWESETGVDTRGRWSLQPAGDGTRLSLEIAYDLPGPVAGLVERLTARIVSRNMEATLLSARRMCEHTRVRAVSR